MRWPPPVPASPAGPFAQVTGVVGVVGRGVAGGPAALLALDGRAVGGEQFAAGGGEVVEDVRVALDDGFDGGLGLLHDLPDDLLGGRSGDRAEQRGLQAGQLVGDGVDQAAQLVRGGAGGRSVPGAAAVPLGLEVLGARGRPGVGVGRPRRVAGVVAGGVVTRGAVRGADRS
ncbi:hypothetical protein SFUMM280S_04366 [Streptomyces fumanus]